MNILLIYMLFILQVETSLEFYGAYRARQHLSANSWAEVIDVGYGDEPNSADGNITLNR